MLANLATRYVLAQADIDDNFDIATRELLYAMIHYQGGNSLTTFVCARIDGRLRHHRNKRNQFPITVPNFANFKAHEKNDLDTPLLMQELLGSLTGREREVIELHFMHSLPLRQIGQILDVVPQTVHNIKQAALNRLKNILLETNYVQSQQ